MRCSSDSKVTAPCVHQDVQLEKEEPRIVRLQWDPAVPSTRLCLALQVSGASLVPRQAHGGCCTMCMCGAGGGSSERGSLHPLAGKPDLLPKLVGGLMAQHCAPLAPLIGHPYAELCSRFPSACAWDYQLRQGLANILPPAEPCLQHQHHGALALNLWSRGKRRRVMSLRSSQKHWATATEASCTAH